MKIVYIETEEQALEKAREKVEQKIVYDVNEVEL